MDFVYHMHQHFKFFFLGGGVNIGLMTVSEAETGSQQLNNNTVLL
jgi:hypothetical protein